MLLTRRSTVLTLPLLAVLLGRGGKQPY